MNQTLKSASAYTLTVLTLLGCGQTADSDKYEAEIRWTSYGIPHVKSDDWGGLGYGFAYATAEDAVCVIAKDLIMVNGELSLFFGPENGNLESDIFHKGVLTDQKVEAYSKAQSSRSNQMNAGYVAGYNRYLADNKETLPASCRDQNWVKPITDSDLARLAIGVGVRYGLGRFQRQIAQAGPQQEQAELASTSWDLPTGIGSNAIAIGKDLSESGRGILFGNPHYPWHGSSRFHMIHTTIPGELDVMGTSLLTTNRVAIGFNKDIAWTHTVSTALRFTLYQLTLNPENSLEYLYDGAYRPIREQNVVVNRKNEDGELIEEVHSIYLTHYGPMVQTDQLAWNQTTAFALRDAVIDNYLTADTYDALNKASSTQEVEAAISKQGVYWTNTIASDRHGNAFYADISGTPNVDEALLEACQIKAPGLPDRLIVLKGNTSDCEWREDSSSAVPGTLPAEKMPRITRDDYVSNSNDSYWLSNPEEPLEGYSPIIGSEKTARSLRTRAGLTLIQERIDSGEKLSPDHVKEMLYSHRNFGAELLLDDLLSFCKGRPELEASCIALSDWDRTMDIDSRGGHLWREFWDEARKIEDLYTVPFSLEKPVETPNGLNTKDPTVATGIKSALLNAQKKLEDAEIALDAKLGDIQYAIRNDKKIGIPGGEGWAGMFSVIVTRLQGKAGYTPIIHGNSFVQVVSWNEEGDILPEAILTYSQSPEPDSKHYSDLTELYSNEQWIRLPFTDEEINADPNLRVLTLRE